MNLRIALSMLCLVLVAPACSSSDPEPASDAGASGAGGAPGSENGSDALCGQRPGGRCTGTHVIRFETTEPRAVVQLRRRYDGLGGGRSRLYALETFDVLFEAEGTCVTESESLEYENTHHNWTDVARARTSTARYELRTHLDEPHTLEAFLPDGSGLFGPLRLIPTGGPPFDSQCVALTVGISEVMVSNLSTHADEQGEYEPWIEIYNPTSNAVDLTGWTLSNDLTERDKWTFPSISIEGRGTLIVFADGETEQGPLHTNFVLSPRAGQIVLSAPDGSTDGGFEFAAPSAGQSVAWDRDAENYVPNATPTPGVGRSE